MKAALRSDVQHAAAGLERPDGDTVARGSAPLLLAGLLGVLVAQLLLLPQLLAPEIPGSIFDISGSQRLLAANGALLLVSAVAAATLPARSRWLAIAPAGSACTLVLAGSAILGGRAWSAVVALLSLLACWVVGRAVTRRFGVQSLTGVAVIDTTLGAAVVGLAVLLLGRVGAIGWWTAGILVLGLGAWGLVALRTAIASSARSLRDTLAGSPLRAMATSIVLLQLTWSIVYVSAPDVMFDALYGKAFLPDFWAETGSIGPLIQSPALNLAGLAQLLATPGHTLGADDVGRWLQIGAWLLTLGTIWWWCGPKSAAGPLAVAILAITPHMVWQNSTAYDDNVLMLPAAALVIAMLRSLAPRTREPSFSEAILLGALAGATLWFKLHLLVLATVMAAGWLLFAGRLGAAPRRAAGLVLGGLLTAGPALLIRWFDTGNPVFPNYNAIFRSQYAPEENATMNFPFWPEAKLGDILRLPYEAVANPSLMTEAVPPGAFGFLIVALVGGVLLGWRGVHGRATVVIWAALVVSAAAWWVQLRYLRYTLPMSAAAALLIGTQMRGLRLGRRAAVAATCLLAVAAGAFLPSAFASFWNVPERRPPFGAAFGRWDDENYLRTVFAEKDALDAYRRTAPSGSLAISSAHERTFTLDRQLSPIWEVGTRLTLLGPLPQDPTTALRRLRQVGVQWAILQSSSTTLQDFPWLGATVERYGEVVYADRGWTVYRLTETPVRPMPRNRCDDTRTGGTMRCWEGVLDRVPGIGPGDSISRKMPVCPGTTIGVTITAAAGGQPVPVTIDADGTTGLYGATQGLAFPGTTTTVYATIPEGAQAATVYLAPSAGMTTVHRITTGVVGSCPSS